MILHPRRVFGITQLIIYLLSVILQKDIVKEGQVLCYIEQLGGQIPVEVIVIVPFGFFAFFAFSVFLFVLSFFQSDVSGEIVKILREDGGKTLFVMSLNRSSFKFSRLTFVFSFLFFFDSTEPVGYNDALITILPSFPGIKKLQ